MKTLEKRFKRLRGLSVASPVWLIVPLVLISAVAGWAVDIPKTGLIPGNSAIRVGDPAPAIIGLDLQGKKVSPETLAGRPIFLDFSSIFCSSCQETIREFKRLQDAYRGTDLALIIVTDGAAPLTTVQNFFRQLGATYTVIRDEGMILSERFGVNLIPYQVTIDRGGKIQKIHVGFNPEMEKVMGLRELAAPPGGAGK